jgi:hypothetical protein
VILHPGSSGAARNARAGTCSECGATAPVYEVDGRSRALCATCVGRRVALIDELLATDDVYEGLTARRWLVIHDGFHRDVPLIGCLWCAMAAAA